MSRSCLYSSSISCTFLTLSFSPFATSTRSCHFRFFSSRRFSAHFGFFFLSRFFFALFCTWKQRASSTRWKITSSPRKVSRTPVSRHMQCFSKEFMTNLQSVSIERQWSMSEPFLSSPIKRTTNTPPLLANAFNQSSNSMDNGTLTFASWKRLDFD